MKFSIITPSFNSERFISETIESVISQRGDFEIEYIVMDNCSSDSTRRIVNDYIESIESGRRAIFCRKITMRFYSGHDEGMYDAICKGFSRATGDIYAWINSDDIYLPGAFSAVHGAFSKYPDVRWLTGVCDNMNENSTIFSVRGFRVYPRQWVRFGLYGKTLGFINQEGVFWRRSLWPSVSDELSRFRLSGDSFVWRKFAETETLYSLLAHVSCFRHVDGQLSQDKAAYLEEMSHYCRANPNIIQTIVLRFFRFISIHRYLDYLVFRHLLRPRDYGVIYVMRKPGDKDYELFKNRIPKMRRLFRVF